MTDSEPERIARAQAGTYKPPIDAQRLLKAAVQVLWKLNHSYSAKGDGSDCVPARINRHDATVRMLQDAVNRYAENVR